MRISDWSSDVCSSDLLGYQDLEDDLPAVGAHRLGRLDQPVIDLAQRRLGDAGIERDGGDRPGHNCRRDRNSVVQGTSVDLRVDLGGRRTINKHITSNANTHTRRKVRKTIQPTK